LKTGKKNDIRLFVVYILYYLVLQNC